jgi:hypothetical protein
MNVEEILRELKVPGENDRSIKRNGLYLIARENRFSTRI